MKKIIIIGVTLLASIAGASLNWSYTGSTLGSGYQDGWLVYMYNDVDHNTDLNSLTIFDDGSLSSADDVYTSISTTVVDDGGDYYWELFNISTLGQFYAYSVVFNSSSFDTATQYIIIDAATTLLPNTGGINNGNYYISNNSGTWNNIQAVPEPATFLLFGMGGFGAWLIRRNKRKA